jgi:hypothetical protein
VVVAASDEQCPCRRGFARFRSGRRRIAIGPGAIAAASDNDPTTIGSLAVVVTAAWVAFLARTITGGG